MTAIKFKSYGKLSTHQQKEARLKIMEAYFSHYDNSPSSLENITGYTIKTIETVLFKNIHRDTNLLKLKQEILKNK
jgi:hypothetical protein